MTSMTPRERVLAAMRRQQPDRVPFELPFGSFTPDLMEVFRRQTGADDPDEYFEYPVRAVGYRGLSRAEARDRYARYYRDAPADTRVNSWGDGHEPGSFHHFVHHVGPLRHAETEDDIAEYPFPDFLAREYWGHIAAQTASFHARDLAVQGELACTIFETSWQIRGMEECLIDMQDSPAMADLLFERVTEVRIAQARRFAEAGVDILRLGDDIASQNGLMFGLDMWRHFFRDRLMRIIAAAREVKPDLLVWYHSDGNCTEAVPDLVEVGVDILNPVQPECMDPAELKRRYGDRLAFWGTIGTQHTMPCGTPDDVRAEVRERIETAGNGGGLLLAPTHVLEPDVPWENVLAFVDAVNELGMY